MSDLIDRQEAIDAIRASTSKYTGFMEMEMYTDDDAVEAIEGLPSAQPEREKGTWTNDASCPFCGFQPWYERDIHTLSFCPNCGADMRGNRMLMLTLDDAVKVAKRLIRDEIDDAEIIRQEFEQKCWIPPETGESAKRLNDLIFDINPAEICSQIESDNLKQWCKIIQTEMKMAMVQLPCWAERRTDD